MKKVLITILACVIAFAANAQQAVDMGLSVKWATCNLGASSPEQFGDYYAWGEISTKSFYDWGTYKWRDPAVGSKTKTDLSKYCRSADYGKLDKIRILEPADDAAHVKLGGKWRIPTDDEWEELMKNCTWSWTTRSGIQGYLVTSKKNGKSIFLPAAGHQTRSGLSGKGVLGFYWSSSLGLSFGVNAWVLGFGSHKVMDLAMDRFYGQSIRPVCE